MFRQFLRAYKIHSRTHKPMYWYAKNGNEFSRIMRYLSSHPSILITVYHPYSLSFTTFTDVDDELYDEYLYSME